MNCYANNIKYNNHLILHQAVAVKVLLSDDAIISFPVIASRDIIAAIGREIIPKLCRKLAISARKKLMVSLVLWKMLLRYFSQMAIRVFDVKIELLLG